VKNLKRKRRDKLTRFFNKIYIRRTFNDWNNYA